jgi:GAF domain-containing protein
VLSVLGQGEFFGEMALIDKEPRSAAAMAKGDAVLFRLSCQEFNSFLTTDTRIVISILESLLATMVKRLRDMDTGFVTIHETGRLLASAMDIDVLLGGVLGKVMGIVSGCERGFIALWNEFSEMFEIRSVKGFAGKDIPLPKNDPVIRWLKEHKELLVTTADSFQRPLFHKDALPDYYGFSFMVQPFIHRGEMLGFLALSNTSQPMDVKRDQVNLLSGIASQIAPVIANAKKIAEDENRKRLQQAKQFHKIL